MDRYPTPPGDSVQPIVDAILDLRRRARAGERPSGTQLASLVQQVQTQLATIDARVIAAVAQNSMTTAAIMAAIASPGAIAPTTVTASGNIKSTGGSLYSIVGHNTPVTSGYVGAWFDFDGRLGASASSIRFKQDIEPADPSAQVDALLHLALIRYRYVADVERNGDDAPWHLGSIAEYMQQTALSEWVPVGEDGEPLAINWEQMAIPIVATLQSLDARLKALEAKS